MLLIQSQICICTLQVEKVEDILNADKLLFPGVGAFEQAMGALKRLGYTQALKDYILVSLLSRQW